MTVINLASVEDRFRFTDKAVGEGYPSLPKGRRNTAALLGYLNQYIDELELCIVTLATISSRLELR